MTTTEYRRRQESIAAGVRVVLAPMLRQLRGQPTDQQWQPLFAAMYRAVFAARVESRRLAADVYAAQRRTQLAPASDSQPPRTSAAAAVQAATAASPATAARHDPAALGYTRRSLSANPCAFCLMRVSRGPVYKTGSTALLRDGDGEPYHDHCSCVDVPVFHRTRWPGREQADDLRRQWREHGGTLVDWRRYSDRQREAEVADAARAA